MLDLSEVLVIAAVNAIVVIGCIAIWAMLLGVIQW